MPGNVIKLTLLKSWKTNLQANSHVKLTLLLNYKGKQNEQNRTVKDQMKTTQKTSFSTYIQKKTKTSF